MTTIGEPLPRPPARDPDGLLLPFNLEAERSTLGAAILYTDAADYIADKLTPDAYHRRAHVAIFEALRAMRREGIAVDFVTLTNRIGSAGLEAIGGPAYLASLADGVPRTTNIRYYGDILRDLQAKRALIAFANLTLDHVVASEHSAPLLIADADRRLIDLQSGHVDGRMTAVRDELPGMMTDLDFRVAHRGELVGLDTGFPSINELTFGWQPSDLIIGAARPSMGKTTLAMCTATHAAQLGKHVAIFSLEMRKKQLTNRMLSALTGIEFTRLMGGYIAERDWPKISEAMQALQAMSLSIDDRAGQSVWDIRAACRRLQSEGGLDLVIIDYVQLMPGSVARKGATRNDEITDISRRLKVMADEIGAPVLLISQLNRASKSRQDKRPQLEDLRESGALEQDADLVWFLYRKHHKESGTTQFILEKARNGPTGTVNLTIHRDTVCFTDGGEDPPEDERPRRGKKKTEQPPLPVDDAATSC